LLAPTCFAASKLLCTCYDQLYENWSEILNCLVSAVTQMFTTCRGSSEVKE
jgi:hypothetical protein